MLLNVQFWLYFFKIVVSFTIKNNLRIAINTRLLIKNKLEGIGWFAFEVLKRIVSNHPEHQFLFLFDRPYAKEFIFSENVLPIVLHPQARHPVLFNIWFDYAVTRALKKYKADVFFSPDGMLSLRTNVPQIAVIHDLNFEHYPEDLPSHITKYYLKRFPLFAKKANKIITVSNFSKKDICKAYAISEDKVNVVYNGASKEYLPISLEKRAVQLCEINNGVPYFIYVGSLHKRKNIERMLQAFKKLKASYSNPLDFIIVGDYLWGKGNLLKSISKDVKFVGRKSGSELAKLVGNSQALVYVSYFEGFGIPVLEGMKSGVPVVASNVTSIPEVGGDAAIYVDPFSVDSIEQGLLEALNESDFRIHREKGLAQADKFNWDISANNVWDVIELSLEGR
jgi:glycosyltransferase involved in cell wall biosynthesis